MQKVLRGIRNGGTPSESPAKGRFDIMKKLTNLRLISLRRINAAQYLYVLITKIIAENSFSRRKVDNKSNNLSKRNSAMSYPSIFSQIKMSGFGKISNAHPKAG